MTTKQHFICIIYATSLQVSLTAAMLLLIHELYSRAVNSRTRSMAPCCSSSDLVERMKDGGLSCHSGLLRFSGRTGRNRMGSSVPFPLLPPPPARGVSCCIGIRTTSHHSAHYCN